ncbi:methylated-DNA--[protein]-cysteine S-methyltransferase [Parvularcula marina]|uniref:Methylated-DNA--protein-cysteine methyltransferase n=1 Tax=Parvularcula marina TaxID=2292771 RepID=A0A371REP2_9PROT|nr:methylated-DNA--[protein]-cysteine S-methyltransferase [Parvularcula marina]RFB03923.1 methylated-DNA--[protein]-cysteine S-methyltransferase [Parvularcula marina]
MTPLIRELIDTPVGPITLITQSDGTVRMLEFTEKRDREEIHLKRHFGDAEIRDGKTSGPARKAVEAYFNGDIAAIDTLTTDAAGTEFQTKVWATLRTIPAGETWSYGDLAGAVGSPKAFRAVGSANGANPIAIIVPCHRVIATGGKLGGYGGGLDRKKWLLAHEAAHCGKQLALHAG